MPFELGITDGHPESGFVQEGTLWMLSDQPFETPQGFFNLSS
jgi:hypothetical protein